MARQHKRCNVLQCNALNHNGNAGQQHKAGALQRMAATQWQTPNDTIALQLQRCNTLPCNALNHNGNAGQQHKAGALQCMAATRWQIQHGRDTVQLQPCNALHCHAMLLQMVMQGRPNRPRIRGFLGLPCRTMASVYPPLST
eukprot:1159764-Pelagomonas_calceolata.AAC.11